MHSSAVISPLSFLHTTNRMAANLDPKAKQCGGKIDRSSSRPRMYLSTTRRHAQLHTDDCLGFIIITDKQDSQARQGLDDSHGCDDFAVTISNVSLASQDLFWELLKTFGILWLLFYTYFFFFLPRGYCSTLLYLAKLAVDLAASPVSSFEFESAQFVSQL